jgi:prephenate dehydrogenase
MPRRALIVGLGLIGGSIGIALKSRGWRVAYVDPNVDESDARRAADERFAGGDVDLVILATPVDQAKNILDFGLPILDSAPIQNPKSKIQNRTTSVASVMKPLRDAAPEATFIAGHPLAGSEQRGLAAARGDLFIDKKWFVDRDDEIVNQLIIDCGAEKHLVDAEAHDRAVALTSHLPQILSTALAAAEPDEAFAGTGLETFLRLAKSDASVWAPVIAANRENIRAHFERVMTIARTIIDDDPHEAFARAQRYSR